MVRNRFAVQTGGRPVKSPDQPAPTRRAASAVCAVVLAVEATGSLVMWAPIPLGWVWAGGRVYDATGSLVASGAITLLGLLATAILAMRALTRIDGVWVTLRRRAGHDQVEGALTRIVVVSATLGLILFLVWYYLLSTAFIIPFMGPSQ